MYTHCIFLCFSGFLYVACQHRKFTGDNPVSIQDKSGESRVEWSFGLFTEESRILGTIGATYTRQQLFKINPSFHSVPCLKSISRAFRSEMELRCKNFCRKFFVLSFLRPMLEIGLTILSHVSFFNLMYLQQF